MNDKSRTQLASAERTSGWERARSAMATRLLADVALGADLQTVLDDLMRFMESQEPGMFAGLLLTSSDEHFGPGSGPSLPAAYRAALHEAIKVVPNRPPYFATCAEAADRAVPVMVSDVAQDDRYSPIWREHMLRSGLKALRSTPVRGSDGQILGVLALYFDRERDPNPADPDLIDMATHLAAIAIERERAKKAQELAAERLQLAMDVAQLGRWEWDLRTGAVSADPRCRLICGIDPGTAPSTLEALRDRIHPEDWPRVERSLTAALDASGSGLYAEEFRWVHQDGRVVWSSSRGVAQFEQTGGPPQAVRMIGTVQDVTERHDLLTVLKEADRRKDEFLATLAHELRNPLAPMRNALHLLALPGAAAQAERVREILDRQVTHMVRLVDDLLEASRISTGKLELKREALDLRDVLRQAVETSRPLIDRAHHRLDLELPEEPLPVDGDSVRLAQVFGNLLNNAAKYSEEAGSIRISASRDGDDVVANVSDSGIGIEPEQLPRVFDMFVQLDPSASRAYGGLGIGLALARRLTEMHGGRVEATSDGPGTGTTFTVRLPLLADSRPEPATHVALEPLNARRILVVDDNEDSADSLGMLLRFLGAEARVEHSGAAALAAAAEWHPSVILLDLGMPRMDGFEVARRLRADPQFAGLKLVALTGWGQEHDRRRTTAGGFDHHLIKPVDLNVLQTLLSSLQGEESKQVQ